MTAVDFCHQEKIVTESRIVALKMYTKDVNDRALPTIVVVTLSFHPLNFEDVMI